MNFIIGHISKSSALSVARQLVENMNTMVGKISRKAKMKFNSRRIEYNVFDEYLYTTCNVFID